MLGATLLLAAATAIAAEPTPGEKALADYASWQVGGVWVGTNSKGQPREYRYEWSLAKKFLVLQAKEGAGQLTEMNGIDPTTGKWTIWGFDDKGTVYKGTVESTRPGEFTYNLSGAGPKGAFAWKAVETKVGEDESKLVVSEHVDEGKKQPNETYTVKRKR